MKLPILCSFAIACLAAGHQPRPIAFEGTLSMPSRLADGSLISLYADARPFAEMATPVTSALPSSVLAEIASPRPATSVTTMSWR